MLIHDRCDIPWPDIKTYRLTEDECENYYAKDYSKTLRINIELALGKMQNGYDAAIVSNLIVRKFILYYICFKVLILIVMPSK